MSADATDVNNRKKREATGMSGMAHDTPRFHPEHAPGLSDRVLRPGRRNSVASATRNMNHVAHANVKVRGGGRYLQKVVSAASKRAAG